LIGHDKKIVPKVLQEVEGLECIRKILDIFNFR
jgi:hypothetical protein